MTTAVDIQFEQACTQPSDIYEHVPVLRALSTHCDSVIELGVRTMVSTWGVLKGLSENNTVQQQKRYIGVDLCKPPADKMELAEQICRDHQIEFTFLVQNDLEVDIALLQKVDLLFIDALHQYKHVTAELEKYHVLCNKYIAFHDTSSPWGESDEPSYGENGSVYPEWIDSTKQGVWEAVIDFMGCHPEWSLQERRLNNHGFTILEKV
jgi:cephalosporin hydroxylase